MRQYLCNKNNPAVQAGSSPNYRAWPLLAGKEIMLLTNVTEKGVEVDEIDADLDSMRWHRHTDGSALHSTYDPLTQRTGKIKLHRVIAARIAERPLEPNEEVDHINGNPADNRRANLRICTHKQNRRNQRSHRNSSSKFVGVCRLKNRWLANITVDAKTIHIGCFMDELEAAWMRDQYAIALFGEYAHLNFKYFQVNKGELN